MKNYSKFFGMILSFHFWFRTLDLMQQSKSCKSFNLLLSKLTIFVCVGNELLSVRRIVKSQI